MTAHPLSTPITQDADDYRRPLGAPPFTAVITQAMLAPPLVFPVSAPGESYAEYHHAEFRIAKAWVSKLLDRVHVETEHDAWKLATDLAVEEAQRRLNDNEAVLLTRAVRDVWFHREMERRRPGSMFAR